MLSHDKYDEKKKHFPETLKKYLGIITPACEAAGISRETYYRWRRESKEFADACDAVAEHTGDFVESQLLNLIKEKEVAAVLFYCKTKLKNRGYVERMETTGKDGGAIMHEIMALSKEDKDALIRIKNEA